MSEAVLGGSLAAPGSDSENFQRVPTGRNLARRSCLAQECSSKYNEVAWTRSPNGRNGDCPVKGNEAPVVMRRQAEQIHVGDLPRAMDARVVKYRFVEDGNFAAPILMVRG